MVYFLEQRCIPFSWKKGQSPKSVIYTILVFLVPMYTQIISEHVISKLKKCLLLLHPLCFLAHSSSIFKHIYKGTVLKNIWSIISETRIISLQFCITQLQMCIWKESPYNKIFLHLHRDFIINTFYHLCNGKFKINYINHAFYLQPNVYNPASQYSSLVLRRFILRQFTFTTLVKSDWKLLTYGASLSQLKHPISI